MRNENYDEAADPFSATFNEILYKGAIVMERHTILNSWKEIAVYMGRAVRTVQRWERECEFPVHRPRGKKRSPVFALSREIDTWLENCPQITNSDIHEAPNDSPAGRPRAFDENVPNGVAKKTLPLEQVAIGAER